MLGNSRPRLGGSGSVPTFRSGTMPDVQRLRQIVAALEFVRDRTTGNERQLHTGAVRLLEIAEAHLRAAQPVRPEPLAVLPWESKVGGL